MKTSARFLSLLLAVLMIASAALTASASSADTKANSEALQLLVDLGIFGGYDDGSLKPDNLVERDEMAKIIFVLYTKFTEAGAGVVSFNDVAADNWAAGYISWCSSKGIVGGYGDGNFGPDDNVTYDQALKMVCGALGYTDWEPAFWPTDVRSKALNELNLGENITGVKGGDYITRAQIAQIVYNALFADMNETKQKEVPIFENVMIQVPVAKTLAVDVWNFSEINAVVTATNDLGLSKVEEEDEDVVYARLDWTNEDDELVNATFSLEELGLEAYANKQAELFMANVRIIYDASEDKFDAEKIIATSVSLTSTKDVTIEYDEKKQLTYVNGEKVDEDYDAISRYTIDNGIVGVADFDISDVPAKDSLYTSIAYDFDDNGEFDAIYWEYLGAYEVVATNNDKITVSLYGETDTVTYTKDEYVSSVALEEEDVVVAANIYGKFNVIAKVAPVEAAASKYSENKLTLEGVGNVEINKVVFELNNPVYGRVTEDVLGVNDKGEIIKSTYYIYDGKVFGHEGIEVDSELKFAILSYFNEPAKAEFNEESKEYTTAYTAVVTIDGKQQVVNVDPANAINGMSFVDNKDAILAEYGKKFTEDGKYLSNHYLLVSYAVDEDNYYSFSTRIDTTDTDIVVYPAGATIKYDEKIGLYSIYEGDTLLTGRVKLTASSLVYYTYKKESTGDHVYLGTFTKETFPKDFASVSVKSDIFAVYNEETKFSEIALMVIDEEDIEAKEEEKADYRIDARQIYYCYQSSNQVMAPDGKSCYYSHFMKPFGGASLGEVVNENPKGTATTQGYAYIWDEETENYVRISNSTLEEMGITSLGIYEIDEIINGCIITTEGKYMDGAVIAPDASIWCLGGTAASISTLTMEGIQKSIDINKEYQEYHGNQEPQRVILGTHLDENGEEVVSVVIIQQFVYDSAGIPARNTTTFINNFNS